MMDRQTRGRERQNKRKSYEKIFLVRLKNTENYTQWDWKWKTDNEGCRDKGGNVVVFFNQHLGAAHSKCWSKYAFSRFFV